LPSGDCFAFAEDNGMIEPLADLGEPVWEGQAVARIYPIGRTGAAPVEINAKISGILAARHFPGLAKPGDCLAVTAVLAD
jgi:N-alpha-acetyl-L-2,4-diaminobutyrate deacetylase